MRSEDLLGLPHLAFLLSCRKENTFSQTISALDFAAPRSKQDADLLYEAKYGKRGEDGKMTREQYQALRRKIGGTAKVGLENERTHPVLHDQLFPDSLRTQFISPNFAVNDPPL